MLKKINLVFLIIITFITISGCSLFNKGTSFNELFAGIGDGKYIGLTKEKDIRTSSIENNNFNFFKKVHAADTEKYELVVVDDNGNITSVSYKNKKGKSVNFDFSPIFAYGLGSYTAVIYINNQNYETINNELKKPLIDASVSENPILSLITNNNINHHFENNDGHNPQLLLLFIHNETGKVFDYNTMVNYSEQYDSFRTHDLYVYGENISFIGESYNNDSNNFSVLKFKYNNETDMLDSVVYNPKMNLFNPRFVDQYGNVLFDQTDSFGLLNTSLKLDKTSFSYSFMSEGVIYVLNFEESISFDGYLYKVNENNEFEKLFRLNEIVQLDNQIAEDVSYFSEIILYLQPLLDLKRAYNPLPQFKIVSGNIGNDVYFYNQDFDYILNFNLETGSFKLIDVTNYHEISTSMSKCYKINDDIFIFGNTGIIKLGFNETFTQETIISNVEIDIGSITFADGLISIDKVDPIHLTKSELFINIENNEIYLGEDFVPTRKIYYTNPLN